MAQDHHGATTQSPATGIRPYTFTSVENADGFISKANSRFLKRDIISSGVRQYHSFFPIGPDVSWYGYIGSFAQPKGIYDYEKYVDSLNGRANYMRVFLCRYQALSLYGPEYTQTDLNGNPVVYFDNTINQKDSAELDYIVTYAKQHGISIMPCVFSSGDFNTQNNLDASDPSIWKNNPFNTILELDTPCDFFTDSRAKKTTKNLFRYIVSRWGYATNIMAWELWNEVDHMFGMCEGYKHIEQDVIEWHDEMCDYIRYLDPFNHLVSTSLGSGSLYSYMRYEVNELLDFVQFHRYEYIQNAESRNQLLKRLFNKVTENQTTHPTKPVFIGEFGFSQNDTVPTNLEKDPFGIDLHNSLWATFFSTSMGAGSFWWWPYVNQRGLYKHFAPLFAFSQNMPIPSNSFTPHHTGTVNGHVLEFPNHIQTYYMINGNEDTIFGWSQDTAFAYQSLRWLTDNAHYESTQWGLILRFIRNSVFDPAGYVYTLNTNKKPAPSSSSNLITIPITNQPVGNGYMIQWYDSETGHILLSGSPNYATVQQDASGNKYVSFQFPSTIRNLQQQVITNKFGDAVFRLVLNSIPHKETFEQ